MGFLPFPGLFKIIYFLVIAVIFIYAINYWMSHKSYLFSEESVAAIARKHVVGKSSKSTSVKAAFRNALTDFRSKYRGHILPDKDLQWIFMNAGGWMGSVCILHASLTEYVLFFGTAVDTTGHSGRYWANITDTILTGTFYQWQEGELERNVFGPGETVFHAVGEATAVSWKSGTWMVEYGRGFMPSTLFFALADSFFSTTDFITVFYFLRAYMKCLLLEVGFYLGDIRQMVKDSL